MSNFYRYLNENAPFSNIEEMVNDCKPFLKELKRSNWDFIYSGRRNKFFDEFTKKKIRKDRKPKDTPKIAHNLLDKAFKEKFGVKARSESMFATKDLYTTIKYGIAHYVFPVGNYQFLYNNEIDDLYSIIFEYLNDEFLDGDILNHFEDSKDPYIIDNKEITYNEFIETTNLIIKNRILPAYKKTQRIPDERSKNAEIMIVADYVWLLNKNVTSNIELKQKLESIIENT